MQPCTVEAPTHTIWRQQLGFCRFANCCNCSPQSALETVLPCTKWLKTYQWSRFLVVRIQPYAHNSHKICNNAALLLLCMRKHSTSFISHKISDSKTVTHRMCRNAERCLGWLSCGSHGSATMCVLCTHGWSTISVRAVQYLPAHSGLCINRHLPPTGMQLSPSCLLSPSLQSAYTKPANMYTFQVCTSALCTLWVSHTLSACLLCLTSKSMHGMSVLQSRLHCNCEANRPDNTAQACLHSGRAYTV